VAKEVEPAKHSKKVVVIGGGRPAGLTLPSRCEAGTQGYSLGTRDELGGALSFIAQEHYKEDIRLYLQYLLTQVEKHPIEVRLNTTATREMVGRNGARCHLCGSGSEPGSAANSRD